MGRISKARLLLLETEPGTFVNVDKIESITWAEGGDSALVTLTSGEGFYTDLTPNELVEMLTDDNQ